MKNVGGLMLKRKIDSVLVEWKKREHNPLIIKGARQIGKTTSIMPRRIMRV